MILSDTPQLRTHTGLLQRQGDVYAGHIVDAFGYRIDLAATLVERDGTRFFELTGVVGAMPPDTYLPFLDDPPDAAA